MQFSLPEEVLNILTLLEENNFEVYLIGGAVRDLITGKIVDDWDFTTNATPEKILKIFPDAFYDNRFGTVGIKSQAGFEPHEITTFRKESGYSDTRHPDKISWGKTLVEDLKRRDFTINAVAVKILNLKSETRNKLKTQNSKLVLSESEIIDLFDGQKDLKSKIIRAVGNPAERFTEDALRMLRAIRISSQLGFTIEENTFAAIKSTSSLINKIAKERIKEELFKILGSINAFEGMMLLKNSGLLEEILPELFKTFGVEQKSPGRHHIYDVGTHLLMSLKNCNSTDPVTRFAVLIHDIGKPQTFKKLENGTITFYNHEIVGTKIAKNISERLRLSKKESEKLITLVRWHQFSVGEMQTDSAIRRFIRNIGQENIVDMLTLRVADRIGSGAKPTSWRLEEFKRRLTEVQKEPFSIKDLTIDGNDVMKILRLRPGPRVGEILTKIFQEVIGGKLENDKKALSSRLRELF